MLSKLLNKFSANPKQTIQASDNESPDNFFIVGCVRSGTTLLRNLLRGHPMLACPEENHMFRWSWPFRTGQYRNPYEKQAIFQKHQDMDGVPRSKVTELLNTTNSRFEFLDSYCKEFLKAKDMGDRIWYEKTPQNVYGMLLIRGEMPGVRFLNIVRNPLNVVASLHKGVIMKEFDTVAACAYWREAVLIADQYRQAFPNEIEWIYYEDLIEAPKPTMKRILKFLKLPHDLPENFGDEVHPERNQYLDVLTAEQQLIVQKLCTPVIQQCGIRDYFKNFSVTQCAAPPAQEPSSAPKQVFRPTQKAKESDLPMVSGNWLSIDESCILIRERFKPFELETEIPQDAQTAIPRTLFQFWDTKEKPAEIQQLIEHNQAICKQNNIKYVLFDSENARDYLKKHFHQDYLAMWTQLPHPAMQSDLIRLCYLFKDGGYYLDADMAVRTQFDQLLKTPGDFHCFQWDQENRKNVCNWLMGSTAANPLIKFILQTTWGETANACEKDTKQALKNILGISGPGAFTKAIGSYVRNHSEDESLKQEIRVSSVNFAYKHVMNGPELLKTNGMEYKKSKLHWQVAAKD